MNPGSANCVSSLATSSWVCLLDVNATALPAMCGAPRLSCGFWVADPEKVVAVMSMATTDSA
jgi:hypothetical protein